MPLPKNNKEREVSSLGELFQKYHYSTNPVTKSVYLEIVCKRLDRLENKTNQIAIAQAAAADQKIEKSI